MSNKDIGSVVPDEAGLDSYVLFGGIQVQGLSGVRVFDVGQGDCIGLLDDDGKVALYVDYGGVIDHPDKGNPANTGARLPVQRGNAYLTIVLTHWDKDHYWSAKKNTDAEDCQWLVPRQKASPTAVRFAARLTNAKCWPESRGAKPYLFGAGSGHTVVIRKCGRFDPNKTSEDRNLTGLAVNVLKEDFVGNDEETILLPGDCTYHKIPTLPSTPLKGLLAYHHGSHSHWKQPDTADEIDDFTDPRTLVYSYGATNPYGHPDTSNYDPDWDPHSEHTPNLRNAGKAYVDIIFS